MQVLDVPRTGTNIGVDTNNFGNITNGYGANAIGVYNSPNGRTYSVFATAEDGYNAMTDLIKSYQSKFPNATLQDALGRRVN
ncbi:MAG: hypothetical protein LBG59_07025 [Candidatus Peribacteria bacterium]|jgi:hypothetical protein|nr:hypothetical protein [Candidatus Peribacteria bacterium]